MKSHCREVHSISTGLNETAKLVHGPSLKPLQDLVIEFACRGYLHCSATRSVPRAALDSIACSNQHLQDCCEGLFASSPTWKSTRRICTIPCSSCLVGSVSWHKDASFELPLSELDSRGGVCAVWKGLMACTPSALRTEPSNCGQWSTSKAQGSTVQVRTPSCPQGAHHSSQHQAPAEVFSYSQL